MAQRGIALFGYYRSAVEVAYYLNTGDYLVTIVDNDPVNLSKARKAGFETAALDFRDDDELAKLGLGESIDTVFCLFPNDADNVFLTLSARALAPSVRIFSIAHGRGAVPALRAAGADKVIETLEISGLRVWDIITRPVVTAILDRTLFGQANLNIAEVTVPGGSALVDRALSELELERNYELILLGVVDRQMEEHFVYSQTAEDMRLQPEDILVVIGPGDAIARLQRDLAEQGR
ncbi:MAG: TrkA family potassium uptake protein [Chromatiaceae bacterium]|nr:TrkA family potassium uptake protein [Gammaproteobacteria bacterium]MCP5306437.1 TrkA family potassium uptake protein [Chromatiaceae bacterium]MCP5311989.1 TrkA family potassium uptake protein [Chromatiaceae bacterium]